MAASLELDQESCIVSRVSATDLAYVGAEPAADFRFAHWAAVRRCVLGLYFASLGAWSAHYGIPASASW